MKKSSSPRRGVQWPMVVAVLILGAFVGSAITTAFQQGNGQGSASQGGGSLEDQIAQHLAQAAQNPNDVHAWVTLGNLYFDTGKPVESIDAYRKALALAPGNPNVLTDMGVMHRQLGQFQEALDAFRTATAADPTHQVSRLNTGIVLLYDMKDAPGALRAWEGLLQINPGVKTPDGTPLAVMVASLKSTQAATQDAPSVTTAVPQPAQPAGLTPPPAAKAPAGATPTLVAPHGAGS